MGALRDLVGRIGGARHPYDRHLSRLLRRNPGNRDLAFAQAIGAETIESFNMQGDVHVAILRACGLADGMAVLDLGCGSGRTAQALRRNGWEGRYTGIDIISRFVEEVRRKCPGYDAFVHREASIPAPDDSLDMVFHWSVFTHLSPERCYLYMEDTFRALKPGGKLVFSFLELTEPAHRAIFLNRVKHVRGGRPPPLLDTFLHRDWIGWWASEIGFAPPVFTDGLDASRHPASWQALVVMEKPATA